ncbi:hypothetical protein DEH80_16580 [Abyssibacter profundi]|uniref:Uncharacterized protein n=2 Tax=Abyssibacter profundi TaxID=2182787 RepID=A0A383XPM2_9GAMM|nr:hypothetical protein DEH80_16580 [Abyssibacter profundi]
MGAGLEEIKSEIGLGFIRQLRLFFVVIISFALLSFMIEVVPGLRSQVGALIGEWLDGWMLILLSFYVAFYFLTQFQCFILRSLDEGALAYNLVNVAKSVEVVLVLIMPFIFNSLIVLAASLALARAVSFFSILFLGVALLGRSMAGAQYESSRDFGSDSRCSQTPSSRGEYGALALWPGLSASLPIILINTVLGAQAVVVFSVHRLFSRVFVIFSQAAARVAWAERMNGRQFSFLKTDNTDYSLWLLVLVVLFSCVLALPSIVEFRPIVIFGVHYSFVLVLLFVLLGVLQSWIEMLVALRAAVGKLEGIVYLRIAIFFVSCVVGALYAQDLLVLTAALLMAEVIVMLRLNHSNVVWK